MKCRLTAVNVPGSLAGAAVAGGGDFFGGGGGPIVTYGRIFESSVSETPRSASGLSTRWQRPDFLRNRLMALAVDGPMPGSSSSSWGALRNRGDCFTLSHHFVAFGVVFGDRAEQRGLLTDLIAVADHHDLRVR